MSQILDQIETLMLGAIPTMILFLALVISYQLLIQGPLSAILTKRRKLTEGAMEEAQKAIASAEARTAEYGEKLRLARSEAQKLREQRVKQWIGERDAALEVARKVAGDKLAQARAGMEAEAAEARKAIEASAGELAAQVVRAVLPAAAGGAR